MGEGQVNLSTESMAGQDPQLDPQRDNPWYRALFLENHQPAWIFDKQTLAFLAVNEAAIEQYGYSRQQFLSMTLKDIRPPEDVPALLDSVANLEFGRRVSGEWRHVTAGGEIRYAETATYDFEFDGRPARLAVINDVTERHRAEEALKQTISDYRGLFENAHDAILILSADPDERVLDANGRACELYGFSRSEFIGLSIRAISKDPAAGDDHRRRTLQRGAVHHFETQQFRKDGSAMSLEINASAVTYMGQQAILSINRDVTARKQTEELIRAEHQKRRLHVEQTPLAVIEWDTNFCVTAWNPGAERMFGFAAGEAIGRCARDFLIPPPARDHVEKIWQELLASRGGHRSTNQNVTRDGRIIRCEWYNTPLVDSDGRVVGVASLVQDVTEAYETRRALERSEDMYRTLAETMPAIVYRSVGNGMVEYVNGQWQRYTGLAPEQSLGRGWAAAIHPDDLPMVLDESRRSDEWQSGSQFHFRLRRHDGQYRWQLARAEPVRDPQTGRVMYWLGTTTDIDDLRRAQDAVAESKQALRESEDRFRQIAENIEEIFWVMDSSRKVLYINPAYERIWQQSVQSILDDPTTWIKPVHPEDRGKAWSDDPLSWNREFRLLRADGSIRWVHSRAIPVRDAGGNATIGVGICTDITERKQMEQRLRDMVRQRTERIGELERQHVESEKLVATGRMAARIAHEINNPLASITSAFALLKDAVTPQHPYFSYVEKVDREIDRIGRITRQMFELYRPETEAPAEFDLNTVLSETIATIEPDAKAAGVTIRLSPRRTDSARTSSTGTNSARVTLPETAVRQVIYNILRNAVQASPRGQSVEVNIEAAESGDDAPIGEVSITIRDRGPGIPAALRDKIFEPFFTTKSDHPAAGLGLGLSIANTSALAMGGRVELDPTVGDGAQFRIVLPAKMPPKSAAQAPPGVA